MTGISRRRLLVVVAAFAAVLPLPASGTAGRDVVKRVPAGIPGNCSRDVTAALTSWIASVPNGSVLVFRSGACYLVEGTLEVTQRRGLRINGNGAAFRSGQPSTDRRAVWRVVDSTRVALQAMTISGSYGRGGRFDPAVQHAHAIDVRGSSVEIRGVTMTDVGGDCVYFGRGVARVRARSSGTVHDSVCLRTGRNAVAVVAGDDILVRRLRTDAIGYNVFDVEPNRGVGYGSDNVRFDRNTIGSYALNAYSVVESGPTSNQRFTNNRVLGHGLKAAVADPTSAGFRSRQVRITGNHSDTPQAPAAINVDNVDGLVVRDNTVPMRGGPMAAVRGSCDVVISGNRYPGGSSEALVEPMACAVTPTGSRPR
jgi:hypothetical protein